MTSDYGFFHPNKSDAQLSSTVENEILSSQYFNDLYPYLGALQTSTTTRKITSKRFREYKIIDRIFERANKFLINYYYDIVSNLKVQNNIDYEKKILFVLDDIRDFEKKKIVDIIKFIDNHSIIYLQSPTCHVFNEGSFPLKSSDCLINLKYQLFRKRDYCLLSLAVGIKYFVDYNTLIKLLPRNISYKIKYFAIILIIAYKKVLWDIFSKNINYSCVINIKHFSGLGAVISSDCYTKNMNSITFQHGVISHFGSSFVPIMARTIICFGTHSSAILEKMDKYLFKCIGKKPYCENYYQDDSFALTINEKILGNNKKNLLFIDQETNYASKFYGISEQFDHIHKILYDLAQELEGEETLTIRIHPSSKGIHFYDSLRAKYPDRIVISKNKPLKYDLLNSGVVFGLFSGALIEAAASGLATYFIWEENWYISPDFTPFIEILGVKAEGCRNTIIETLRDENNKIQLAHKAENIAKKYFYVSRPINDLFNTLM